MNSTDLWYEAPLLSHLDHWPEGSLDSRIDAFTSCSKINNRMVTEHLDPVESLLYPSFYEVVDAFFGDLDLNEEISSLQNAFIVMEKLSALACISPIAAIATHRIVFEHWNIDIHSSLDFDRFDRSLPGNCMARAFSTSCITSCLWPAIFPQISAPRILYPHFSMAFSKGKLRGCGTDSAMTEALHMYFNIYASDESVRNAIIGYSIIDGSFEIADFSKFIGIVSAYAQ